MMNTARVSAYAKLNLTLDISGAEGGFHMLDSLVVTVNLADRVVVKKRKDGLCSVRMHGMKSESIPPEENNALKAAEAFVWRFHTKGADITVYKNIPIGAGLGGSSVDAAGVLLAMAKLYGVPNGEALHALADELGSDIRFLLSGGFARMRGRGEEVQFLDTVPEMHFLVLCPKEGVSTAECFAEYDKQSVTYAPRTERALEAFAGNLEWAARLFGNHLLEAAKALNPAVGEALAALRAFSPLGTGMTGSGSAVFALFATEELAQWAKSRYKGKCRAYVLKSIDPKKRKIWRSPYALAEDEGREGV